MNFRILLLKYALNAYCLQPEGPANKQICILLISVYARDTGLLKFFKINGDYNVMLYIKLLYT